MVVDTEDIKMEEIWKDVPGYEGIYIVSSFGRIRNLVSGKFIKSSQKNDGYCRVCLSKNGCGKCINIHRLVAQVFIPNPDNLPQVNHRDEDKTNNVADNLEWCDAKYNINYGTSQQRRILTNINSGKYTGLTRKEYKKEYYQYNKERLKEYHREYYKKHKK